MKHLPISLIFLSLGICSLSLPNCTQSSEARMDELAESTGESLEEDAGITKDDTNTSERIFDPGMYDEAVELSWTMLRDVSFEEKYYESIKEYLLYPTFGQSIKDLEGKTVYITGYVIPVEAERYVLSANPFASCFFCGNAGPETIVELELTHYNQMFYTDEWRTFKGRFQLNTENIDRLNYLLMEAEPFDK